MSNQNQQDCSSMKRKHENDDLLDNDNEKNLALDESYITMIDVLKEEEKLEEDAYAVLGGSDDKNCTYEHGYIDRQALYSCKTCMGDNPKDDEIFGICLACSYACHEKHDLFELYTKRSFRCDCGTKKMKGQCTLNVKDKSSLNEQNKYNHNFIGNYCVCDKPYPNTEDPKDDQEMVQCIICEDWFHSICLECDFPDNEDYSELICKNCMNQNQFLWYYQIEKLKIKNEETQDQINVIDLNINDEKKNDGENIKLDQSIDNENKLIKLTDNENKLDDNEKQTTVSVDNENKTAKTIDSENKSIESTELNQEQQNNDIKNECKLKLLKLSKNIDDKNGTTFWDEGWRSKLCKCDECLKLYADNKIEFLINENDTVHYYEAKGKEKGQKISQYERGLDEITKIDRVVGIEAITEFNEMSQEFKEHFKKFAEDKKVIAQKDIEDFFESLKYKKRMKLNNSF